MSVTSTEADIVACSGCPVDLIRTIDEMQSFTHSHGPKLLPFRSTGFTAPNTQKQLQCLWAHRLLIRAQGLGDIPRWISNR